MAKVAIAVALLTTALAGCGADETEFPDLNTGAGPIPTAAVANAEQAEELCTAAENEWPEEWEFTDQVKLDVPELQVGDPYCVRQD